MPVNLIFILISAALVFVFSGLLAMAGLGAAFLFVPLFYYMGVPLAEATATALLLNVVSLLFATINYWRGGLVNFKIGLPVLIMAVLLAPLGARMTSQVDKQLLLTMFAAFACNRVRVGSMVWGGSGFSWPYTWIGKNISDLHNDVHHNEGPARQTYIECARDDRKRLGDFVLRLRNTPEGDGNMLDNTIVLGISHFSGHHDIRRLPCVLFGTAKGGVQGGRCLKFTPHIHNDKVLTSVGRLMGLTLNDFGDDQNCGPVPGLV